MILPQLIRIYIHIQPVERKPYLSFFVTKNLIFVSLLIVDLSSHFFETTDISLTPGPISLRYRFNSNPLLVFSDALSEFGFYAPDCGGNLAIHDLLSS